MKIFLDLSLCLRDRKTAVRIISEVVWTCVLVLQGVFCAGLDDVSVCVPVIEGDSVTLPNDFKITNQDKIRWYFENTPIAEIDLYNGKNCTDVQCNNGTERFRNRLKLDHQTGNLTIMNSRSTDSGNYKLEVVKSGDGREKTFHVKAYRAGSVIKYVKKGDSVTLENNLKRTNQYKIRWYFENTQIAQIDLLNGESCTDVQCNEGDERFRDRLKLDHQTGNLTIMNITNIHCGEYTLDVFYPGGDTETIFIVTVLKATDDHENPEGQSETSVPDSGLSTGAEAGICVAVLLVIGAASAVIYYLLQTGTRGVHIHMEELKDEHGQEDGLVGGLVDRQVNLTTRPQADTCSGDLL